MSSPQQVTEKYWSIGPENLLAQLGSSVAGLSAAEARQRLDVLGANRLQVKNTVSRAGLFLSQFKSPIILILLAAAVVSAFVSDWVDALIILLIVFGSAALSFVQEYNAQSAALTLQQKVAQQTQVLRDQQEQTILSEQVVPGDIVILAAGSLIPADGVLLEAKDFFVNQAVLTGETFPVEKMPGVAPDQASLSERFNTVWMGTNVRSGSGRALVVHTGRATVFGQLSKRLTLRPPETAFERGIRRLGMLLTEIMLLLVLAIFFLNVWFQKPVLDSLLFSIALAVGLTPQLLPAIININLSKGSQAMAERGVIVRRLEAIENFGSMDILCTDKTGTITAGVVRLDAALDAGGEDSAAVRRLAETNARFQTGLVNPLDAAILAEAGVDLAEVSKLDEVPYDFQRKRLSVLVQMPGEIRLVTKGALESVLSVCSAFRQGQEKRALEAPQLADIAAKLAGWSEQGYRVLGVASKKLATRPINLSREDEQELVLEGFLLFFDPPKSEARAVIQRLIELGVQLKIITGDNPAVAAHAAQAVGLDHQALLTGRELEAMGDEALWHAAEKTTVFADVDPNEKEKIILALKKTGHVVGYMGDGINDAPSLHSADVGISVDNAVEVAKEAADFVLMESDLAVLEQGIIQGRKTFANTMKYIYMATSANFGNMFSMAIASIFLPYLPMLPKQILLINFLTDLPEFTIAEDNVDPQMVARPRPWDISQIRNFMLVFGPLSSVFDLSTFAVLLLVLGANESQFHTAWFIESVISACLVVFVLRTWLPLRRSHPSRWMLTVSLAVMLAALVLPYTPLAGLLSFTPLPLTYLAAIGAIAAVYLAATTIVRRWFFRRFLA